MLSRDHRRALCSYFSETNKILHIILICTIISDHLECGNEKAQLITVIIQNP